MAIAIGLTADFGGLHRMLRNLGVQQVPFATALALTRLARGVADTENAEIERTFDTPTPFTRKAFSMTPATKAHQVSYVWAKDIQAQYLRPYVEGGLRSLGGKNAMLVPKDIPLNQYGNLPRNKLKQLKGRRDVFVGRIRTMDGRTVSGLWQRPLAMGKAGGRAGLHRPRGRLRLLVRFEDTTPVRKHLPFVERARAYIAAHARDEIATALRQAARTHAAADPLPPGDGNGSLLAPIAARVIARRDVWPATGPKKWLRGQAVAG